MKLPVILKFDPDKASVPEVREIFQDEVARTIWMGFRMHHIVSQYFNHNVLDFVKRIRSAGIESITVEGIMSILMEGGYYVNNDLRTGTFDEMRKFWEMMLPFIKGEKEMTYVTKVGRGG